jgi:RHS repeat-associated protein
MTGQRETLLCLYSYDPLDRVVGCAPLNQESLQRYYRKNRLATEIQGPARYSVFEHEEQLLAQQQHQSGSVDCALLATDLQRSVLHSIAVGNHQNPVYSPYGHRSPESGLLSLLGFNGERRDPLTGHYLLGQGYRAFNPVLMRFNSSDRLSPFGRGGVNGYAYCLGDPVNMVDPRGEFGMFARGIDQLVTIGQTVRKQLSAVKKAVVTKFSKAPTLGESGRESLLNLTPKSHRMKVTEAMVRVDELNLYQAGAEYRQAAKKLGGQEVRAAKQQRFAERNQFPDDIKYKDLVKYQSDFQQADQKLMTVAMEHVLKYPGELMATDKLIHMIRGK